MSVLESKRTTQLSFIRKITLTRTLFYKATLFIDINNHELPHAQQFMKLAKTRAAAAES